MNKIFIFNLIFMNQQQFLTKIKEFKISFVEILTIIRNHLFLTERLKKGGQISQQKRTHEQRREYALKAWETKRKKKTN